MNRKHIALLKGDAEQIQYVNRVTNDSLQTLLNLYASTRFTTREAKQFDVLKANLAELVRIEEEWVENPGEDIQMAEEYYARIETNLNTLSDIQVIEGKRQIDFSNRSIARSDLMSTLEIGMLIAIGVIRKGIKLS